MRKKVKRGFRIEQEIERYCISAAEVLTKLRERIEDEEAKKPRKKKKAPAALMEFE